MTHAYFPVPIPPPLSPLSIRADQPGLVPCGLDLSSWVSPRCPHVEPRGQGPCYCPAGCLAMTTHTHTHTLCSTSREKQGNVPLLSGLSTPSNIAFASASGGSPSECAPRVGKVASGPNARSPLRCGGCCCLFCSANTQEFAGGKGGLPSDSFLPWGNKEACK